MQRREEEIAEGLAIVVRLLVDRPGDVKVQPDGTVLHVSVHKTDLGKVIGKQGRIARSLRILLMAMAAARDESSPRRHLALDIVGAQLL